MMGNSGTLTACPKQPFPSTSPWIRSEGLKMRCIRSPGSTRRDSERTMSLFWDKRVSDPGDRGHLSILQLRLRKNRKLRKARQWNYENDEITSNVITYIICLDRIPVVPCCWGGERLILVCSSLSSRGLGSSSRLGSFWAESSFLWARGPGPGLLSGGLSEWRCSWGGCGLCSMVSCSGLLVSWMTRCI